MTIGKAAVFVEPGKFEIVELPPPTVEPGGVLIKVASAAICGSDLHFWRGEMAPPSASGKPGRMILGHELAGRVDILGKGVSTDSMGQPLGEGDRVVFAYFFPCHRCYNCLRGELNHCPNRFRFRATIEEYPFCTGGFSDYYYLRPGHYVFKVPDTLSDETVTQVNCAVSQVVYGLRQANVQMGDRVVIQGAGGLGINATAVAKEMGAAPVITIDGQKNRLEFAKRSGADYTININEYKTPDSRVDRVKTLTDGIGADVVVEVVGYPQVVPEGIEMLRTGGTYVEIGNISPGSNVEIDMSKLLWKAAKLVSTAHYDPYILPVALDFLTKTMDKYPLDHVMSHSFPLEQIEEAFTQADWSGKTGKKEVMRAFVTP